VGAGTRLDGFLVIVFIAVVLLVFVAAALCATVFRTASLLLVLVLAFLIFHGDSLLI
jgi:hypothetical protein